MFTKLHQKFFFGEKIEHRKSSYITLRRKNFKLVRDELNITEVGLTSLGYKVCVYIFIHFSNENGTVTITLTL